MGRRRGVREIDWPLAKQQKMKPRISVREVLVRILIDLFRRDSRKSVPSFDWITPLSWLLQYGAYKKLSSKSRIDVVRSNADFSTPHNCYPVHNLTNSIRISRLSRQ